MKRKEENIQCMWWQRIVRDVRVCSGGGGSGSAIIWGYVRKTKSEFTLEVCSACL